MTEIIVRSDLGRPTYAKVIADSISPDGVRLTTFEAKFWRPVLAEFNTHCVLSRNSASSRAIPLHKMVERVRSEPATPLVWAAEQKGMQGGDEVPLTTRADADQLWIEKAMDAAVEAAEKLGQWGIHKSIANRLIEPFMWHTAVVTATAWENFFEQRCSPLAQPEIREVAEMMREARELSTPTPLREDIGQWHVPYVGPEEGIRVLGGLARGDERRAWAELVKISAARCARVSYLTQDGRRDIEADLALYERLVTARPAHWSPLEHVATPWAANRQDWDMGFGFRGFDGRSHSPATEHLPKIGKLLGWRTLRTTVETELEEITYR